MKEKTFEQSELCTAAWNDLQRKKPPVFDASTTILYAEDLMIPMFITIKTTRRYGENTETIKQKMIEELYPLGDNR